MLCTMKYGTEKRKSALPNLPRVSNQSTKILLEAENESDDMPISSGRSGRLRKMARQKISSSPKKKFSSKEDEDFPSPRPLSRRRRRQRPSQAPASPSDCSSLGKDCARMHQWSNLGHPPYCDCGNPTLFLRDPVMRAAPHFPMHAHCYPVPPPHALLQPPHWMVHNGDCQYHQYTYQEPPLRNGRIYHFARCQHSPPSPSSSDSDMESGNREHQTYHHGPRHRKQRNLSPKRPGRPKKVKGKKARAAVIIQTAIRKYLAKKIVRIKKQEQKEILLTSYKVSSVLMNVMIEKDLVPELILEVLSEPGLDTEVPSHLQAVSYSIYEDTELSVATALATAVAKEAIRECTDEYMVQVIKQKHQNPLLGVVHQVLNDAAASHIQEVVEECIKLEADAYMQEKRMDRAVQTLIEEAIVQFCHEISTEHLLSGHANEIRETIVHEEISETVAKMIGNEGVEVNRSTLQGFNERQKGIAEDGLLSLACSHCLASVSYLAPTKVIIQQDDKSKDSQEKQMKDKHEKGLINSTKMDMTGVRIQQNLLQAKDDEGDVHENDDFLSAVPSSSRSVDELPAAALGDTIRTTVSETLDGILLQALGDAIRTTVSETLDGILLQVTAKYDSIERSNASVVQDVTDNHLNSLLNVETSKSFDSEGEKMNGNNEITYNFGARKNSKEDEQKIEVTDLKQAPDKGGPKQDQIEQELYNSKRKPGNKKKVKWYHRFLWRKGGK